MRNKLNSLIGRFFKISLLLSLNENLPTIAAVQPTFRKRLLKVHYTEEVVILKFQKLCQVLIAANDK